MFGTLSGDAVHNIVKKPETCIFSKEKGSVVKRKVLLRIFKINILIEYHELHGFTKAGEARTKVGFIKKIDYINSF